MRIKSIQCQSAYNNRIHTDNLLCRALQISGDARRIAIQGHLMSTSEQKKFRNRANRARRSLLKEKEDYGYISDGSGK
ncbi:MAG: hypothetical protein QNJ78_06425, partial [Gammaproteobacteria bacterium]|nr:hypothetical protein [Gammaproteobacteria bacterium]